MAWGSQRPQIRNRPEARTPSSGISHLAKAIAAIYRAVAAGSEGYGCVDAAVAADDGEGFSLASAEPATASTKPATAGEVVTRLGSPRVSARSAPLRIVGETSRSIEFLLSHGEEKLCSAVGTCKGYIGKGHGSSSGLVDNRCAHASSVSSGTAITIPKEGGPAQFR